MNVRHMFLGSSKDNTQDASKKGRLRGRERSRAGILYPHLAEIRRRIAAGESNVCIARTYDVWPQAISAIRHRQSYEW